MAASSCDAFTYASSRCSVIAASLSASDTLGLSDRCQVWPIFSWLPIDMAEEDWHDCLVSKRSSDGFDASDGCAHEGCIGTALRQDHTSMSMQSSSVHGCARQLKDVTQNDQIKGLENTYDQTDNTARKSISRCIAYTRKISDKH